LRMTDNKYSLVSLGGLVISCDICSCNHKVYG
jgi:hypothetical protein